MSREVLASFVFCVLLRHFCFVGSYELEVLRLLCPVRYYAFVFHEVLDILCPMRPYVFCVS